jgi:hypothetical protein
MKRHAGILPCTAALCGLALLTSVVSGPAREEHARRGKGNWALYDLEQDIGERDDVSEGHPHVVKWLEELVEKTRDDMGDRLTKQKGRNARPLGRN